MVKSAKSRAEEQFAAIQKRDRQAVKEKEAARQESANQVSRLRALRLAKEAAEKTAAKDAKDAKGKKAPRKSK